MSFDLDILGGEVGFHSIVNAVLEAGALARKLATKDVLERAVSKADDSPVTEVDKAIEDKLFQFLRGRFPAAGFVGEETGAYAGEGASTRFIVDPIDGTRALIRGLPSWSVLLGVEHEGVPSVGIAYMPAIGELFVAVRGHSVLCNGMPPALSGVEDLSRSAIGHGALSQFRAGNCMGALDALAQGTYTQRGYADFENIRRLLCGSLDGVVDPAIQPWDMCAVAVIVREAGGRYTDLIGNDSIYGGGAIASNGKVHDDLVNLIAASLPATES